MAGRACGSFDHIEGGIVMTRIGQKKNDPGGIRINESKRLNCSNAPESTCQIIAVDGLVPAGHKAWNLVDGNIGSRFRC